MAENGNATGINNSVDIKREDISENGSYSDSRVDYRVMPGSQLDSKQFFTNLLGKTVKAKPVLVDFKRLLQVGNADSKNGIIDGISNRELLHAVVGLYDVSLSEMTPDVLYSTVCEKWARTVVLVRDTQEVLEEVRNRKNKSADDELGNSNSPENSISDTPTEESSMTEDKDAYEPEESKPSVFYGVFSDTEDEEEEEEESDEEDFSVGINTFIKDASSRRRNRKEKTKDVKEEDIGVESRLLACATFEKKFVNRKDRVIHLTLITVRERFRNFGIGKYLLSLVTSQSVVGSYEAVVVHADNAAVKFFQKYGFSDDVVLNSRFSELAEQFTNCTLMCYLPGFSGAALVKTTYVPGIEFFELEHDFNRWKDKTLEAYQAQVGLVMRMKHEILQLKSVVKSQSELLTQMAMENNKLKMEKLTVERDFISHKLSTAASQSMSLHSKLDELNNHDDDENDDICTEELIEDLQRQVDMMQASLQGRYLHDAGTEGTNKHVTSIGSSNYVSFPSLCVRSQQDPYDHTQDATMFYNITENFMQSMKLDPNVKTSYEVTSIAKATLSEDVKENFNRRLHRLHNSDLVAEMYYCGSLEKPTRIPEILKHGFSEEDYSHGDYGKGLYFSKYPSTAAQFSALGKLLLAEVGLGTVETVIKAERTKKKPADGFDSIITPGRLAKDACGDIEVSLYQEYIVFDVSQVKPICLISYQAAT